MSNTLKAAGVAAAIAALALTTACSGAYMVGYRASYGNDLAQPTSTRGSTTSVRYRDYGGVLSKALLLLLTAPAPPSGTTTSRVVGQSTSCGSTYCTTTTETEVTYTPPSPEEMAAYAERAKEWGEVVAPAIMSGAFRAEAVVDVASENLGGDTSGFMMGLNFRIPTGKLPGFVGSHVSVGMAGSKYVTHGRAYDRVIDDGNGALSLETVEEDQKALYFGMPVKLTGLLSPKMGVYAQADVNFMAMFSGVVDEGRQPQLYRVGGQWLGKFFYVSGELSMDRMRLDSLTASAEVGLAF